MSNIQLYGGHTDAQGGVWTYGAYRHMGAHGHMSEIQMSPHNPYMPAN